MMTQQGTIDEDYNESFSQENDESLVLTQSSQENDFSINNYYSSESQQTQSYQLQNSKLHDNRLQDITLNDGIVLSPPLQNSNVSKNSMNENNDNIDADYDTNNKEKKNTKSSSGTTSKTPQQQNSSSHNSSWNQCQNPWGYYNYREGDVILLSQDNQYLPLFREKVVPQRFVRSIIDHNGGEVGGNIGYIVLKLNRDSLCLEPWGFEIHRSSNNDSVPYFCIISSVLEDSPAFRATDIGGCEEENDDLTQQRGGLQVEDTLLCVNGLPVEGMTELELNVHLDLCGPQLIVVVKRNKKKYSNDEADGTSTLNEGKNSFVMDKEKNWRDFSDNDDGNNDEEHSIVSELDVSSDLPLDLRSEENEAKSMCGLEEILINSQEQKQVDLFRRASIESTDIEQQYQLASLDFSSPDPNTQASRFFENRLSYCHDEEDGTNKTLKEASKSIGNMKKNVTDSTSNKTLGKSRLEKLAASRGTSDKNIGEKTRNEKDTDDGSKQSRSYHEADSEYDNDGQNPCDDEEDLEEESNTSTFISLPLHFSPTHNKKRKNKQKEVSRNFNRRKRQNSIPRTIFTNNSSSSTMNSSYHHQTNPDVNNTDQEGESDSVAYTVTEGGVCICGKEHAKNISFFIQCDQCDTWFFVSPKCVGFEHKKVSEIGRWFCSKKCKKTEDRSSL